MILDNLNNAKKSIDTTNIMTNTTLTHERSTIVVLMFILKIKKASEMQQPSCKSNSFGQTGFLLSMLCAKYQSSGIAGSQEEDF